jgi:hypothetical protein
MESISKGCLSPKRLNMFKIFFIVSRQWHFETDIFAIDIGEKLLLFENGGIHHIFEVSFSKSTVPVIDYVASVHYLTEYIN